MEDNYETQDWHLYKSVVFYIPDVGDFYPHYTDKKGSVVKLAAFDMDSTIISSNKGAKFATGVNDYIFAYPNIAETMLKYKKRDYCLAIISNRRAKPDGRSINNIKQRIKLIFKELGFECFVFLLTGDGEYRKPGIAVLDILKDLAAIDKFHKNSFFCGDAAKGCITEENKDTPWYKWTDSDCKLVENWNKKNSDKLKFYLPNQIFDDFPEWETTITSKIKLVITCGQIGSGYPTKNEDYTIEGQKRTILIRKLLSFKKNFTLEDNNTITVITGSHPTLEERESIRKDFNCNE